MDASRCCKHRSGKKLRTVQSEDRDSFQPTLNSHGGKLSDRERKTSRAEPWTRAHKLQVTAIAIAVVLGVTGLVFTLSVNAFKDQSAATTTSQESTVNESSAEASPPNDGCKQSVDLDKPAGWGPARLLTPADDFVEWPALNQDGVGPWGDERNFYVGRPSSATQESDVLRASGEGSNSNVIRVERGKFYVLSIYVHNSANESPEMALVNTRAKVSLPVCAGKQISTNAFLSADNASPDTVWGGVTFWSDEIFNLAYVPGSARICNNYFTCRADDERQGTPVTDALFTLAGQQVGFDSLDGVLHGNYNEATYIHFVVRPQFAPE
jgi:hypothetical protein